MPPPSPLPKYIWKILDSDPSPLPEGLPLSDLDRGDGFIHLSTPEQVLIKALQVPGACFGQVLTKVLQVPGTCGCFLAANQTLYLLQVPLERVKARIKWDDSSDGCFPHLYDADLANALGSKEVKEVIKCERQADQGWEEIIQRAVQEGGRE
ncbi:1-(5-phosphoribosyl)-5-[(5-phosphoribosylamino)methylideneamino] imidazole-4-carboxamide isomerase [Venturia nashicola]|uniref:1-(5-phosphoribosyl)-5-[(5-phosphoribosylamino)methylideneamino] imidazole-4-carboxamide isomerase n=1 Tax=Venturia nashicola TaxID=86259 RepID=A0A4Z1PGT3_9PEZI|nr:1-(5-phosphoribosyl)-5-[(5-phosphoribosylamino)methylideneamino] imidazole-4-carboxamide isomerase [Venturia nashicola]